MGGGDGRGGGVHRAGGARRRAVAADAPRRARRARPERQARPSLPLPLSPSLCLTPPPSDPPVAGPGRQGRRGAGGGVRDAVPAAQRVAAHPPRPQVPHTPPRARAPTHPHTHTRARKHTHTHTQARTHARTRRGRGRGRGGEPGYIYIYYVCSIYMEEMARPRAGPGPSALLVAAGWVERGWVECRRRLRPSAAAGPRASLPRLPSPRSRPRSACPALIPPAAGRPAGRRRHRISRLFSFF